MRLGCCSRTNDVVEPMIKPQWYVNCSSMAKQALDAAIDGENPKLEFFPKQYLAEWKRFSYFIYLHITYKMKLDAWAQWVAWCNNLFYSLELSNSLSPKDTLCMKFLSIDVAYELDWALLRITIQMWWNDNSLAPYMCCIPT